jgi:hypothetical protein
MGLLMEKTPRNFRGVFLLGEMGKEGKREKRRKVKGGKAKGGKAKGWRFESSYMILCTMYSKSSDTFVATGFNPWKIRPSRIPSAVGAARQTRTSKFD